MKNEIEKAIKETLVIKNPESIWRAVDKITAIVEQEQALNTSSVSKCALCGSDDLFKFKLEHIKCKSCDTRFEHSC